MDKNFVNCQSFFSGFFTQKIIISQDSLCNQFRQWRGNYFRTGGGGERPRGPKPGTGKKVFRWNWRVLLSRKEAFSKKPSCLPTFRAYDIWCKVCGLVVVFFFVWTRCFTTNVLCLSYHSNTEAVLFACLSSGWDTIAARLLGPKVVPHRKSKQGSQPFDY